MDRKHTRFSILWRYGLLLLPAGVVGFLVAQWLPEQAVRAAIGVFVLGATWAPGALLLGAHPEDSNPNRRFIVLGGAAGFMNITIGASGPLIAPFFLNLGLTRQALVGTKAACQALGHLVKIAIFGSVGFAFGDHMALLVGCCACVVAGSWVGSRILHRVSDTLFVRLYKSVLTLIALRLVLGELWAAIAG